jgi:hypothetical protein
VTLHFKLNFCAAICFFLNTSPFKRYNEFSKIAVQHVISHLKNLALFWYVDDFSVIRIGNLLMLHIILKLIKWESFLFDCTLRGQKVKL